MDHNIPSYTRGKTTYYDLAGMSFVESMKVSMAAGWNGAKIFDSTRMDCPKWVEQQVLARKRREARKSDKDQENIQPFAHKSQKDLFKPRHMSGIHLDALSRSEVKPVKHELEWKCEYCQMMNGGESEVCAHCGATKSAHTV